jgi:hypothetical protein
MSKYNNIFNSVALTLLFASPHAYATCTPNITNSSSSSTSTLTSTGVGDCVENSGTITASELENYGIISEGASTTITNTGNITGSGMIAAGIYSFGESATIINTGKITPFGDWSYGIISTGTSAVITNYGNITANGQQFGYGIFSTGASATINNNGTITARGITSTGVIAYGIYSEGSSATINNSGTITTNGLLNSTGIYSIGESTTINNSGTIQASGTNAAAIYLADTAHNNTVNILRGSVIVGDIYADPFTTGTRLNINLGAGVSYAYSVTGPWTVTDLDNRPMVTGSAYAAGIGAQETAAEMLYQRTSVTTSALDRRLRAYASDKVDNQHYWLDVYYSDATHKSGGNYSTQTAFSNYNSGITAGFKLPVEITPLELAINVEQGNLNIDNGSQKVDSSSIMAGILAPNLTDVLGAKLSAKALVGYADYDGDRKVMTNSLLYNGSRQINSDYNSVYGVVGTALTKLYPITDRLTADLIVGVDINAQRFESYKESDYFAWNSRTLTQLQSRVQTGLDYKLWGDKGSVFARVGAEHRDLIGGATQHYSINGNNVSFNTNNKNDTYLTAQLGIKAQLKKYIQLFGLVNTLHSSDSVNSVSGNIGLKADF